MRWILLAAPFLSAALMAQNYQPAELAQRLKTAPAPLLIQVGFRVNYNGNHITNSIYAGPGNSKDGIAKLMDAVAKVPKTAEIVIYCGCCPWENCPNIHPAFAALRDAGFTHVRMLQVDSNLHDDWTAKGFPVEKGAIPNPNEGR